ncbi:MAG: hypothetical protein ACM3PZ_01030 [Bacillota bacterium]
MKASEYIIQSLESLKNEKVNVPDNSIELVGQIYQFLMSKKFRKYAVTPEYQKHILAAVENSVAKNEPIKLTLVFGGYKLWRLEESPEVDWAELFSLIYYTKWLKPILDIYKPGVWFDFFSDDVILEIMDNIPKANTEKYAVSFKNLLKFIKPYIPANLDFTFHRVGDQYDSYEDFKKDLAESIDKIKEDSISKPLTPEQFIAVELNVKLRPGQDSDSEWREKVNLIHEGYSRVSKRRPYYRNSDKILIITRPVKDSLAVGTTKRSVVKFWIGAGVLGREGDEYVDYIFSPKQLGNGNLKKEVISIAGLDGKNFKEIRILDGSK